jgi:hypothetical protein
MQKYEDMSHALLSCEPFGFHKLVVLSCPHDFLLFEYLRDGHGFCIEKLVTSHSYSKENVIVTLLPRKKCDHANILLLVKCFVRKIFVILIVYFGLLHSYCNGFL